MNNAVHHVTITIVANGAHATGKTTAIDVMVAALKDRFEIVAQYPAQRELSDVETYVFIARRRN